jgi:dTDP-4-dehydrorhamnose reductase
MKILLFGKNGQVGWELNRTLLCLGELFALDYPEVDFEKPREVVKIVDEIKPDLIVNAAAYTNVDKAEEEPEKAQLVNAITPGEVANWCKNHDAVLIHYSTDYVFDGTKGSPYTEEDEPNPINIYGKTKLEGEKAIQESGAIHLILRTAWVYSMRGNNFVTKVLEWAKKSKEIRVVDDQISNPTWARALAEITANIIAMGKRDIRPFFKYKGGLYHCAGSGYCSRYEWAKFILENSSIKNINLLPAKSGDFINSAKRPCYSALFSKKFYQSTGLILPSWKLNLILALSQKENKLFQTH